MANILVIEKQTGGYFSFILNGDTANKINSTRNDLLTVGTKCHFKTSNGANLIKEQEITPQDITLIAGGVFSFSSVAQLFTKLIEVDFFAWLIGAGGGGSGGVSRFDELIDTFKYTGKDGQFLKVDESQLKLVTEQLFNYRTFTDLEDTPDILVADKMVVVNPQGTALILKDQPLPPEQFLNSLGFFYYADLSTQTTSLPIVANTPKVMTNDGLGVATLLSENPYGVSTMFNTTTNQIDFSQLSTGDQCFIRVGLNITTGSNNAQYEIQIRAGIGSGDEVIFPIFSDFQESSGTFFKTCLTEIFVAPYLTDYPAEIRFLSNKAGSVKVVGFYFSVLRKNLNIVDVNINSDYHNAPEKITIVDADEVAGQNSQLTFASMKFTALNLWNYIKSKADTFYQVILTETNFGAFENSLTAKPTPIDADFISIVDTADSNKAKKTTFTQLKAFLKTYYDTVYATIASLENYYTKTEVDAKIPINYSKIVYVNATSPTTATIFDLNNPPVTNDDLLKTDVNNLYIGSDASTWVYQTSPAGYVTKPVASGATIQIEVGSSQNAQAIWNNNTIIFTASCTITIPASLVGSYIFNGVTLAGVTVTWAIVAPHTWLFATPSPTAEKQIFTLMKRGTTNSILLLGV
jgi:hypothetical protein